MIPRIVFSDVDGTLLNSRHEVLPGTVYAVNCLADKDIPFVIVSARSPSGIVPVLKKYGFSCPIICYSGALILDRSGNILYSTGIDKSTAKQVITFIETSGFDCSWNIYSVDTWIVRDRKDPRIIREENIVNTQAVEGNADLLPDDAQIGKILCMCSPDKIMEIERQIKGRFPGLTIVRSSDILIEIMAGGVNKSCAVREYCRQAGVDVSETIAFGDHYNDMEMLKTVGMPFLMGNAPEELKTGFGSITSGNDDEGIYKALVRTGAIPEMPLSDVHAGIIGG